MRRVASALALAGLSMVAGIACSERPASEAPAPPPQQEVGAGPVEIHGVLHEIMHGGQTEGRVAIAPLAARPHTYALGALAQLDGEVTLLDSVAWLARPSAAGDRAEVSVTRAPPSDVQATLLIAARVSGWVQVPLAPATDVVALAESVETAARARGMDPEQPFPFLIEGPVRELHWHVIDGRRLHPGAGHESHLAASVRGQLPAGSRVTMVGFYSRAHEGVVTHMGEHMHVHVVSESPRITGHVDRVATGDGATLSLPQANSGP